MDVYFSSLKEQLDTIENKLTSILKRLDDHDNLSVNFPKERELLTVKEAAEFLCRKVSGLYQLTHSNRIPHYKEGGKLLKFCPEELREWQRSGKVKTSDEIQREVDQKIRKLRKSRA